MKVAVTWELCGYVDINADTMEEAMKNFREKSDDIEIPAHGEYVDGSFHLSSDDVEEMEIMSDIYKKVAEIKMSPCRNEYSEANSGSR